MNNDMDDGLMNVAPPQFTHRMGALGGAIILVPFSSHKPENETCRYHV